MTPDDDARWRLPAPAPPTPAEALRARAARLGHLALLRPDPSRAAYLGWLGEHNVGDEAVHHAYQAAFAPLDVRGVPTGGRLLDVLRDAARRPLFGSIMLGGGTLIGTRDYREAVERLAARDPGLPLLMLGTGVEDPGYEASYAQGFGEELQRWAPLLRRFEGVAVRGPRSADIVHALGVDAEMVGDAALLLTPRLPPGPDRTGPDGPLVAVNLGVARHIFGDRPAQLLDDVARAVRKGTPPGARFRVMSVWPPDDAYAAALAERLGPGAVLVRHHDDPQALVDDLARCEIAVGLKLHFVVLAAAAGVPGVMLSYHPKCEDFHRSIGAQDRTVRTDAVSVPALAELVRDTLEHRDARAAQLDAAVQDLRGRLRAHAARGLAAARAAG